MVTCIFCDTSDRETNTYIEKKSSTSKWIFCITDFLQELYVLQFRVTVERDYTQRSMVDFYSFLSWLKATVEQPPHSVFWVLRQQLFFSEECFYFGLCVSVCVDGTIAVVYTFPA